jgi:hypothetical protein
MQNPAATPPPSKGHTPEEVLSYSREAEAMMNTGFPDNMIVERLVSRGAERPTVERIVALLRSKRKSQQTAARVPRPVYTSPTSSVDGIFVRIVIMLVVAVIGIALKVAIAMMFR